jgi:nucleotide-binding universal stress UspA family protein
LELFLQLEKDRHTILVTWDYTNVSEFALLHAIRIAKMVENNIRLIHVIDPSAARKNFNAVEERFRKTVEELQEKYGLQLQTMILKGNIFAEISSYASESDANMVIMGTHGITGVQKLIGSRALKVIAGSMVPFIVIQDKPHSEDRFRSIVFPIDFKAENKEKLQWAIYLGKYFDSKVYLFKAPVTDKGLIKKVNVNLTFAVKFLIQNNLDYEIHTGIRPSKFAVETLDFAQKINADLILITTTKYINFADLMFGAPEQFIIANSSKIPVMCVNPKAAYVSVGQFMWGKTSI